MTTGGTTYPRLSRTARRWFEVALAVVWLGGMVVLLEVVHAPWWWAVVLLGAVIVVELAFVRWNEGRWPSADEP